MEEQVKEMIRKSEKYWIKYKPINLIKQKIELLGKKNVSQKENINNEQNDCISIIRIDNMQKTKMLIKFLSLNSAIIYWRNKENDTKFGSC